MVSTLIYIDVNLQLQYIVIHCRLISLFNTSALTPRIDNTKNDTSTPSANPKITSPTPSANPKEDVQEEENEVMILRTKTAPPNAKANMVVKIEPAGSSKPSSVIDRCVTPRKRYPLPTRASLVSTASRVIVATPTVAHPIAGPNSIAASVPPPPVADAHVQQLIKKAHPTKAEKDTLALHGQTFINWYHTHKRKLNEFESRLWELYRSQKKKGIPSIVPRRAMIHNGLCGVIIQKNKSRTTSVNRSLYSILHKNLHDKPTYAPLMERIHHVHLYLTMKEVDFLKWKKPIVASVFILLRDIRYANIAEGYGGMKYPLYHSCLFGFLDKCENILNVENIENTTEAMDDLNNPIARVVKRKNRINLKAPNVESPYGLVELQIAMKRDADAGKVQLENCNIAGGCPGCGHHLVFFVVSPNEVRSRTEQVSHAWDFEMRNQQVLQKGKKKLSHKMKASMAAKKVGKAPRTMVICMCSVNRATNAMGLGCIKCETTYQQSGKLTTWDNILDESLCDECDCKCNIHFALKDAHLVKLQLEEDERKAYQAKEKRQKQIGTIPDGKYMCDFLCL